MKNKRGLELVSSLPLGCKTCLEKMLSGQSQIILMIRYKVLSELFQKLHLIIRQAIS